MSNQWEAGDNLKEIDKGTKRSTTKRPTRNITAGDLGLSDHAQIMGSLDRICAGITELQAQRDDLLEIVRGFRMWYRGASEELPSLEEVERAILRATGQK